VLVRTRSGQQTRTVGGDGRSHQEFFAGGKLGSTAGEHDLSWSVTPPKHDLSASSAEALYGEASQMRDCSRTRSGSGTQGLEIVKSPFLPTRNPPCDAVFEWVCGEEGKGRRAASAQGEVEPQHRRTRPRPGRAVAGGKPPRKLETDNGAVEEPGGRADRRTQRLARGIAGQCKG